MNMMETARVDAKAASLNEKLMTRIKADEILLGIKDPRSAKSFENYRKTLHQTWSRAAALPSPAPRGHFLREFGQSDRDVIENASDEASVPQALTIMNGSLLSQITSGWPTFSLNLRKAATNEEKIDVLFLSLYSRPPTAKEKTHVLQTIESYASNKNLWEDITLAALSTRRFIFVE